MKNLKHFKEQTSIEFAAFSITFSLMIFLFAIRNTFPQYQRMGFQEETVFCILSLGFFLLIAYWIKNKIAFYSLTVITLGLLLLISFLLQNNLIELRPILCMIVLFQIMIKYPSPASFILGITTAIISINSINLSMHWNKSLIVFLFDLLFAAILAIYIFHREESARKELIIQQQRESIKNLTRANHQFLEYLENVEIETAEKERNRITRELHDSIGYALTNVSAMMETIPYLYENDPEKMFEFCRKSQDLANTVMQEVRTTLYILRSIKEKKSENPALFFYTFCKEFNEATGIRTEFIPLSLPPRFEENIFKVLYRTSQVGFINALRHAHADHIKLFLHQSEEEIELKIWNNLKRHYHIPDSEQKKGIGLRGIDERLSLLGGRSELQYVVDGFELVVTIPIKES
jgi:signal transduction histidine kinase